MVRRELGGTEWTDQQGNSKCSDAWKVHKFPVHEVAILSGYFEATKTSDANKLKEWDGKCGGKAKTTGDVVVIALPEKQDADS